MNPVARLRPPATRVLRRVVPASAAGNTLVHASSITRALNLIGDRSVLLVLYGLFLGMHRFGELQDITALPRSLLSNRLRRLEQAGLLRRQPYQARPPRFEYRLTAMGKDLYDIALALIHWDKRHHHDPACVTHRLVHAECGQIFTPMVRCGGCQHAIDAREVEWQPGPGSGHDPHPGPSMARRTRLSREALAGRHAIMGRCHRPTSDRPSAAGRR
jgi:DNA-binding HxlR family transcriptional regulator